MKPLPACLFPVIGLSLFAAHISMTGVANAGSQPDGDKVAAGKTVYNSYCITCHGPNMVNFGTRAPDLRKFPADEKERFATSVLKGKNSMPAWENILRENDIEALWAYVLTRGN